jgi:hypothetical protein
MSGSTPYRLVNSTAGSAERPRDRYFFATRVAGCPTEVRHFIERASQRSLSAFAPPLISSVVRLFGVCA